MTRLVDSRKSVPGRNCLFFATSMKVQAGKSLAFERLLAFGSHAAVACWVGGESSSLAPDSPLQIGAESAGVGSPPVYRLKD